MRIDVDSQLCQGHLVCAARAPRLFDSDELGYAVAIERDLDRDEERAWANAAASACPEGAVKLIP